MPKPTTVKIRLNSSAGTGHFYVAKKNTRTMTDKFKVRKYDPVVRKHVDYVEGKIVMMLAFCTAWPAAPLPRLSQAPMAITRLRAGSQA